MDASSKKIIHIASMPKAGTYLFKELVSLMGFNDRKIHFHGNSATRVTPGQFGSTLPMIEFSGNGVPYRFENNFPITSSSFLSLLLPGDIFASHLPPHMLPYQFMNTINTIFCVRNPYKALERDFLYGRALYKKHVNFGPQPIPFDPHNKFMLEFSKICSDDDICRSFVRYLETYMEQTARLFSDLLYWNEYKNCFMVRFEDAVAENTGVDLVQKIAEFLGVELSPIGCAEVYRTAISTQTPTKSVGYVENLDIWTADAYSLAKRINLPEISETLGYTHKAHRE